MFDKTSPQFAEAVSSTIEQTVESTILNQMFREAFIELLKAIVDKAKEEWDKKAKIEIDHENYVLEYDEATDSYSWKKSDELGNFSEEELTKNQIQNIVSKLIEDEPQPQNQPVNQASASENPALRITASLKEGGEIVIYEQINDGTVTTNLVTDLGKEEIIDAAWEPLNQILPPDQLEEIADELLNQVAADINSEEIVDDLLYQVESQVNPDKLTSDIETSALELLSQVESQLELEDSADELITQVESQTGIQQPDFIVNPEGEVSNNKPGKIVKRNPSDLVFFEEPETDLARIKTVTKEVSAANVSYSEAASSPELSDSQKSWVREKQVPIYADTIPRRQAVKQENKQIAIATKELVRKYAEIQEDGSVAYKSDAFTIIKTGKEYTIHHRKDELFGYSNPIMSFSLDRKGNPRKINADKLNGAERQEFLLVADNIRDDVALPDKNADVREMGNQLGSLAPAGTQKVLTSFRNAEVMKIMADSLQASGTNELKIGDFRIKGERSNSQATLQLYKTEADGSERVRVDWEAKQGNGTLETNMKTMKLSEHEINQLKFVAQNANLLNNRQYLSTLETKSSPSPTSVAEIPLPLHPALAREWEKIESAPNGKSWTQTTEQGNDELRNKLKTQEGKLSIPEQREMYAKLALQRQIQLNTTGISNINLPPLKNIIKDLGKQRQSAINKTYTPTPKIESFKSTSAAKVGAVNISKKNLEM